ncbi:hypothetical protein ABPG73_019322 [Tetrahymena malaccensis]
MSVLHKYDRSFFTCSICLSDEFSNGGELPLQLSCDHIFHLSCYRNLAKFKKSQKINCPNCRSFSQLKRISYEIFEKSEQIFLEIPISSQILVIWINSNSSFEDIIEQVFIVKGDEYMKYIINGDCYLITPIGKIIKYNDVKSHQVKDYDIKKQQKLILRVFNNNQGQIDQIIK